MTASSILVSSVESTVASYPVSSTKSASDHIRELIFKATRKESNISSVYKELLRNLRSVFSQINIVNAEGNPVPVKCETSIPERAIGKLKQENNLILPIMGIEQISTSFDENQGKYFPLIEANSVWDDKKQKAIRVVNLVSKPITVEYELAVWTKYKEDMDQIVEQINLMFHPSIDLMIPQTSYAKMFLTNESGLQTTEAPDQSDRILIKIFNFNVDTYIPSPKFLMTSTGQIERFNVETQIINEPRSIS